MQNRSIHAVGLPWYEPDSYSAVCALMTDADRLFPTYAAWLAAAQRTEDTLRGQGHRTVRVALDLIQFPAWCAAHRPGQNIDAKARSQYASFIAAQQHMASQGGAPH